MRCEQFEQRLQRCLDRRQRPSDDPALRRHAGVCPQCRGTLAACARLADGLDLLELPVPDESFPQRVVSHVRVHRRSPVSRRRLVGAVLAVAASLLVALLPQFVVRDQSPSVSERTAASDAAPPVDGMSASPRAVAATPAMAVPTGLIADVRIPLIPWTSWPATWSFQTWDPIDRLAGGLTPITASLGVAVQEIRRTIPLGRAERPAASSGAPIRQSSRQHASPVV